MNAQEFMKIIGLIRGAYPHIDRFQDNDVKDVWYECLQDLEYCRARTATLNVIKKAKDFPPDIATIREEYDSLAKAEKSQYYAIKSEFERCRNYYPCSGSIDNGWPEFQERLKKAKTGMQVEAARYLANKVIGYVHECECNGTDPIDFAECIKTVAV